MNLFELAAQRKYRYSSPKGLINTEQLYGLSKIELDQTYKNIEATQVKSKGLLGTRKNPDVNYKLEIISSVFDSMTKAEKAAVKLMQTRREKQILLEAAATVKVDELTKNADGTTKSSKQLIKEAKKL